MNRFELGKIAEKFSVSPDKMEKLQDIYLEKKKNINVRNLNDHLRNAPGSLDDKLEALPTNLKKYFAPKIRQSKINELARPKIYDDTKSFRPDYWDNFKPRKSPNKKKQGGKATKQLLGDTDKQKGTETGLDNFPMLQKKLAENDAIHENFMKILSDIKFPEKSPFSQTNKVSEPAPAQKSSEAPLKKDTAASFKNEAKASNP